EFCLSNSHMEVMNFHTPNPVAALPSYLKRKHEIVFLNEAQIEQQYAALKGMPTLEAAARIMIELGLRRSEALWLTKDSFAPDFSMVSIVTRYDSENDVTSSYKTEGSRRAVPLSDALREFLPGYLAKLSGNWVLPSPKGKRWDADNFSTALSRANKKAALKWTCGHYRHTYATRKAFLARWSSIRIARVMGTSVAMIDKHYAGHLHPDA
ncbi:MAG: tyrosine-type recombinase/integrase, partial [Terrimicrobiaceae bacterium]